MNIIEAVRQEGQPFPAGAVGRLYDHENVVSRGCRNHEGFIARLHTRHHISRHGRRREKKHGRNRPSLSAPDDAERTPKRAK